MAIWRATLVMAAVLAATMATVATAAFAVEECPDVKKPVCATNGRTYKSECLASKAGAKVKFQGSCLFPTSCNTKSYAPVCEDAATRGKSKTWPTACVAKLNGVKKFSEGQCRVGICTKCRSDTFGCKRDHRCKGDKRYTCTQHTCLVKAITDKGARLSVGGCSPVFYDAKTGYIASACLDL